MGIAEFIKARFIGQELCVFLGDTAETITYDQSWAANKEYFKGIVLEVCEGILCLEIAGIGVIYINCENIQALWQDPFDYHSAIHTSLTRKLAGARRKITGV